MVSLDPREAGVRPAGRGIWSVSAAHDATTTADALERMDRAVDALQVEESAPGHSTR